MKSVSRIIAAAIASLILAMPALAHAFLDHAVPGVGMAVSASPAELELTFTQDLVPAFSGVQVAGDKGAVAIGRPVFGPANTMHVRLAHALKPGTYVVSWHVVSVDTHRTQGSYKFTIAP